MSIYVYNILWMARILRENHYFIRQKYCRILISQGFQTSCLFPQIPPKFPEKSPRRLPLYKATDQKKSAFRLSWTFAQEVSIRICSFRPKFIC